MFNLQQKQQSIIINTSMKMVFLWCSLRRTNTVKITWEWWRKNSMHERTPED